MKYKLTEEALKMKVNSFAINFGINTKIAVEAFATGEIEIDDSDILAGIPEGVLAKDATVVKLKEYDKKKEVSK